MGNVIGAYVLNLSIDVNSFYFDNMYWAITHPQLLKNIAIWATLLIEVLRLRHIRQKV